MTRLIRADLLKLRRRTGMLSVVALFVFGSVAAYFGAGLFLDANGDFETAAGVLTLIASVAGAIVGATAGGADIESGVFRDLVATGRSRTALFVSRVPAAWIVTLGMLALAVVASAVLSSPSLGELLRGGAQVLVSGALTAAVCVGLAALTGKSGPVMGIALAFQLGVAPLLAQLDVLGDARWALPAVAISRLDGPEGILASLPLAGVIGIILVWAAAGLGGGLWKTRTQEI
jgi:ABC-type transport system involved in cytochrome c biogenesis permease component